MTQYPDFRQFVGHDGVIAHLTAGNLVREAINPPLSEWEPVRFQKAKVWMSRLLRSLGKGRGL